MEAGAAAPLDDARLTSPCTGVCRIEAATGWCRGCRRTRDEIGRWTGFTPAERRAVLARLPERALIGPG